MKKDVYEKTLKENTIKGKFKIFSIFQTFYKVNMLILQIK